MDEDKRPRCPHCGEPARKARMLAKVVCELTLENGLGKILFAERGDESTTVYECGGGHRWE